MKKDLKIRYLVMMVFSELKTIFSEIELWTETIFLYFCHDSDVFLSQFILGRITGLNFSIQFNFKFLLWCVYEVFWFCGQSPGVLLPLKYFYVTRLYFSELFFNIMCRVLHLSHWTKITSYCLFIFFELSFCLVIIYEITFRRIKFITS